MAEKQSLDETINNNELINNQEEFMTIISLLNDRELAILHEALQLENEQDQVKMMRKLRNNIIKYDTIYNAYTARVLVLEPNYYIKKEIVNRFIHNLHLQ